MASNYFLYFNLFGALVIRKQREDMLKTNRIRKSRVDDAHLTVVYSSIHLFCITLSAGASQQGRAVSHSKVRQCYYLTLIVMGKSTIKLQIERNTIELANAFNVYVQIVICNHNFSHSMAKREMKMWWKEKRNSVLYFNLLQNFSFTNDRSIKLSVQMLCQTLLNIPSMCNAMCTS